MKDDKLPLKPVLTPKVTTVEIVTDGTLEKGQCVICRIDDKGAEIPGSEFTTSLRMWDKTYSKNTAFKLKKK